MIDVGRTKKALYKARIQKLLQVYLTDILFELSYCEKTKVEIMKPSSSSSSVAFSISVWQLWHANFQLNSDYSWEFVSWLNITETKFRRNVRKLGRLWVIFIGETWGFLTNKNHSRYILTCEKRTKVYFVSKLVYGHNIYLNKDLFFFQTKPEDDKI